MKRVSGARSLKFDWPDAALVQPLALFGNSQQGVKRKVPTTRAREPGEAEGGATASC